MTRVSCTFGGPLFFPHEEPNYECAVRIEKAQASRLNPTFTETKERSFEASKENSEHSFAETKSILKKPKPKSSLSIPPPLVIQSPRVKIGCDYNGATDSSDDLMLPSELAAKIVAGSPKPQRCIDLPPLVLENDHPQLRVRLLGEKSKTPQQQISFWNQNSGDFNPISFDSSNSARGLPQECDTPSRLMLEMKVQEAQENVEHLVKKWAQNIEESKANSRIRMERLLSIHSLEMSKLDQEFGESKKQQVIPSILSNVRDEGQIIRARHVRRRKQEEASDDKSLAYIETRKELVERQTKEILELNSESNRELQSLQERKEKELERPKAKLDTLINEFNSLSGTRKIPIRREARLISPHKDERKAIKRLSLKSKPQ